MAISTLFIDTDVLIDYLRGRPEAITFIEDLTSPLLISAITSAGLYSGVREGDERKALNSFMAAFVLIPIDENIAVAGGLYRRDYGKSHNVGLADALIAATAEIHCATLVTLNQKHFPMLANVNVPYVKK